MLLGMAAAGDTQRAKWSKLFTSKSFVGCRSWALSAIQEWLHARTWGFFVFHKFICANNLAPKFICARFICYTQIFLLSYTKCTIFRFHVSVPIDCFLKFQHMSLIIYAYHDTDNITRMLNICWWCLWFFQLEYPSSISTFAPFRCVQNISPQACFPRNSSEQIHLYSCICFLSTSF